MSEVTIVSNRLPVSVKKVDGKLEVYPSSGGLATGLSSYTKNKKNKWVGWPGIVSEDLSERDREVVVTELAKHNCYPVFLTQKQIDSYYNGYSNSVLWPFFHNMPITAKAKELDALWRSYQQVNQLFADTVISVSKPETTIWVHDYQLLLVPDMLRAEHPYELIGFFLHIPFPPAKNLKKLQHGQSLVKGIVGADLVGFHTDAYVQDFLEGCDALHVGKAGQGSVVLDERVLSVGDFPLGIDYAKFSQAGLLSPVQKHIRQHKKRYGRRRRIILTVDRLDPTKGLVERLVAYQELLRNNRRLRKRVVMVMLAIPSRIEITAYKKLKDRVEELVLEINATYGKRRWQPVHYMYKSVPFEELAALYRIADVAFIAPIKDGMNLVAKEYVASRPDKQGVLVLSETAGAANELNDALLVNPRRSESLVTGLHKALNMRPREFKNRFTSMHKRLSDHTVHHWTRDFMDSLQPSNLGFRTRIKHLSGASLDRVISDYVSAKNPTLLLDYDGVLAPFADNPNAARPSDRVLKFLSKLALQTKGNVMIISGRNKESLSEWLGGRGLTLAAEHGALMKSANGPWKNTIHVPSNWKKILLPVLQKYADKTPGAFVEEKEASLVWHYRVASVYYAQKNRTILIRTLKPLLRSMGLKLYRGNMILEIKSPEANKGVAAEQWVKSKHDFVLAIGDDYTDEDTFAAMPEHAHTIKVGRGKTQAGYRLNSVDEVHKLLEMLAEARS